jgi:hypothetical protein
MLKKILKHYGIDLKTKEINLLSQIAPKTIKNKTSIPDGYIYTEDYNFCIGIETKIETSSLDKKQLTGHLKQLSEYNKSFLIVLSPDEIEPDLVSELRDEYKNLIFISWIDLLNLMAKIGPDKHKNPVGEYLFDEFMNYIERHYHMTPFTGINFREGYDKDLATHYVKRLSENLTPEIRKLYPQCIRKRPKISVGGLGPWEAWYSSEQVQFSIHPGFAIDPEKLRCVIVLPNGCKKEWKNLKNILVSSKLKRNLKNKLKAILDKAPRGAETIISFRQRHYYARSKPVLDAMSLIKVSTLLGVAGSKENEIWWELIKSVASTKGKYNYQMEIGYEFNHNNANELKTPKAPKIMLKCFKNLKQIYNLFVSE